MDTISTLEQPKPNTEVPVVSDELKQLIAHVDLSKKMQEANFPLVFPELDGKDKVGGQHVRAVVRLERRLDRMQVEAVRLNGSISPKIIPLIERVRFDASTLFPHP